MNLGVLLDNAIQRFADRPALIDDERCISFQGVGERIRRLGTALANLGLDCGGPMASLQLNSLEAIEIDLMAAKFGFCRTLLNARSSRDEHAYAINHCGAKVLVFGETFMDHVDQLRPRLSEVEHYICVGNAPEWATDYEHLLARTVAETPPWEVTEDVRHSVYYTSGTTGAPKGVVLSQRNWLILVRNYLVDVFRHIREDDVLLHAAPLSHASGCMVVPHFVRGAVQRVMPRFDPIATYDQIEEHRVTTTMLAPTMIHMMLDVEGAQQRDTRSLHSVLYGGAPMAAERVRDTLERWGPVLIQGYGQWEAPQMVCALSRAEHADAIRDPSLVHRMASCGRPLTYVEMGVMDEEGNLLPRDQEGEIVIAGDLLMVGYLGNEAATEEIRVGKWQRTGDIGRIDEDGYVYLTDRKNDVIITGGSNVYPREIEETLYTHPDVMEAVAIGIPSDRWGETIHAVVVARSGRSFDSDGFLEWCRERLAPGKRPRSMDLVDSLPKSAYGKILRREIRQRYWEGSGRRI